MTLSILADLNVQEKVGMVKYRQWSGINATEFLIPPSKLKGKYTHRLTKVYDTQEPWSFKYPIKTAEPSIFLFSILTHKTKQKARWAAIRVTTLLEK